MRGWAVGYVSVCVRACAHPCVGELMRKSEAKGAGNICMTTCGVRDKMRAHLANAAGGPRHERPLALVLVLEVLRLPDEGKNEEGQQERQQRERAKPHQPRA